MNLFRSLSGAVEAELTGADIPASLMAITGKGIEILSVVPRSELSASIQVNRKQYPRLKQICEKRGDSLHIKNRYGLYWMLKRVWQRPVLVGGILLLFILLLYLPTRVLFVKVEGNASVPTRQILEAAAGCGIEFGASRKEIRSERVKNALLQKLPQLQWAGVNTYGCTAVITVTERSVPLQKETKGSFGHIAAIREGIILHCTATRGTLLCQPGQAVVKNQVLISGYTDCGLLLQASGAEGEVYGKTVHILRAVMPSVYTYKTAVGTEEKKYSLLIGKKRINLWKDSGIWDRTCGRIYEENYIKLPGGFQLPVGWSTDIWIFTPTESCVLPESVGKSLLRTQADAYLRQQMIAGTVDSAAVIVEMKDGCYRQEGKYVCTEMIGKLQTEQIGETNGKSD